MNVEINELADWLLEQKQREAEQVANRVGRILVDAGQADRKFKWGETIRYSPTEVVEIIRKEWNRKD